MNFLRPAFNFAFSALQDISILPTRCVLCTQIGDHDLCQRCHQLFFLQLKERCLQCGLPLHIATKIPNTRLRCGSCISAPPHFDTSFIVCDYSPPYETIPLALKFGHQLSLALFCADRLFEVWNLDQSKTDIPDFFCPVPLGTLRLAERGFNQSIEIARPLAKLCKSKLEHHILFRQRETLAQSHLKLVDRQKNVKAAFALHPEARVKIQGKHIAVVDDVMTTGSTLNEIAALLKKNGAKKVSNFVFARTDN